MLPHGFAIVKLRAQCSKNSSWSRHTWDVLVFYLSYAESRRPQQAPVSFPEKPAAIGCSWIHAAEVEAGFTENIWTSKTGRRRINLESSIIPRLVYLPQFTLFVCFLGIWKSIETSNFSVQVQEVWDLLIKENTCCNLLYWISCDFFLKVYKEVLLEKTCQLIIDKSTDGGCKPKKDSWFMTWRSVMGWWGDGVDIVFQGRSWSGAGAELPIT